MPPQILQADAHALPLPDHSVDLIVTSPPYFGLGPYTDQGRPLAGQLGAEDTPQEYLDALLACTREMVRVLTPAGSLWINLGDRYSGYHHDADSGRALSGTRGKRQLPDGGDPHRYGAPAKSLMGLPWRYALRAMQELDLLLRAEVIWSKTAGMPESVTDRVRRSHETWFHFTLQPRYYAALDRIREPHAASSLARAGRAYRAGDEFSVGSPHTLNPAQFTHPAGRLPGSVWEIGPQPLSVPAELGVRHHAAFPMEWPRRLILGWSPAAVCTACGQGRVPRPVRRHLSSPDPTDGRVPDERCACPEPDAATMPGVVCDPFGGTGTVALVAAALGRHGISIDASADYSRLAAWRSADPATRARAARSAPTRTPPRRPTRQRAAPRPPATDHARPSSDRTHDEHRAPRNRAPRTRKADSR